jgi:hypothetical protein
MQCIIQLDQTAHTAKHDDKARPAEEERVPSLTAERLQSILLFMQP